ncbi:MAG: molecular chaperone DnaJ [Actinomycetota bacterium]
MAHQRDLYDVLGVSREATQDEIKKAFRALAREFHPDVNKDPEAERRFKEANLAYETLSDPAKRRRYDMFGGEGFTPDMFSFGDLSGIFEAFFGGGSPFGRTATRQSRTARGADQRLILEIAFEEAVFGAQREIAIEALEACERCGGKGSEPGTEPTTCSTCRGTGQVSDVRQSVFGTVMTSRTCGTCRGTGEEIASPCRDCRGAGRLPHEQIMTVDVPAGVTHGMELRIEGAGDEGRVGGGTGDLYLALSVSPHPVFERHGQDLLCALELPVSAAILGADIEIETLDGTDTLSVPAGTQPGSVMKVSGKGVPNLGRRGRGDLLVRVDVVVPDRIGRRERPLIEEFAERRGEMERPLKGRLRPPRL